MSKLPKVDRRKVIKALRKLGYDETEGTKHTVFVKDDAEPITVPRHAGDLADGTMKSIIRATGLTNNEFCALL